MSTYKHNNITNNYNTIVICIQFNIYIIFLPLKSKYKLLKGHHKNKVSVSDILNYCYYRIITIINNNHRWMETRGKSSVEIREMFARAVRSNFQNINIISIFARAIRSEQPPS